MMQESVDVLLKCVSQNIGFSHGKPVAALTIYKCLIHWKLFEAEKTSIFDRIVPLFGSAIEVAQSLYTNSFVVFMVKESMEICVLKISS